MTKTVITGASGFIGSHLMKKIDASTVKHPDICVWQYGDFDKLFFLSTYGNMSHHHDYEEMLTANVKDLMRVLLSFKGWLCYMSSSSVTLPAQTSYSRFKRAGEEIVLGYPEVSPCVVRPYSVIGVGEQKQHLIPTLIRSCMEGEEMPFDPDPVHDFIDVEDVVDGLVRLADEEAPGIHEFGKGVPVTNHDVLGAVQQATGRKANVTDVRRLRGYDNPNWYCSNPSRFCKPKKILQQSITEMVEAYKNEHA